MSNEDEKNWGIMSEGLSILSSDGIGSALGFELFVHRFDFVLDTFDRFEVFHCLDV